MPSSQRPEPLIAVLTALRDKVMGVSESVISTVDGLLVAADTDAVHPESIAALSAATFSLGRRMAEEAGAKGLRDVATRGVGCHVVVQAINERALLTVVGDDGLDLTALHRELHSTIEELVRIFAYDVPA
ncbi:roadblock/LC7 domain-containing protein [Streptomyces sp. NPDC047000]|uniref:roadblock/LC7 domain-containing protein n=1 Tax=Streptomyces sp. NPDC047000 TaxID=3155474 RepID=UPI0033DFBB05